MLDVIHGVAGKRATSAAVVCVSVVAVLAFVDMLVFVDVLFAGGRCSAFGEVVSARSASFCVVIASMVAMAEAVSVTDDRKRLL